MSKVTGRTRRAKGRLGQREASKLLESLGYTVIEANSGKKSEDFIAIKQDTNETYSVEVKNHKKIDVQKFLKQAKDQANLRKLPWMLLMRLGQGYGWLVLQKDKKTFVANL